MTKISTLNPSRAATNYLVGLCRVARDFQIDKYCRFVDDYAHTDGTWIERLREQARLTGSPWSEWHKFRIAVAINFFQSEMPWVTNAKLGLADDLVTVQGLIYACDTLASNNFSLKYGISKELTWYVRQGKQRADYELWQEEVRRAGNIYDNLLSDIITVYREAEKELEKLRREIICQAYMSQALPALDKLRSQTNDGTYLLSYARLRQIVQPVRRLGADSFQYRIAQLEQSISQHLAILNKNLHEVDGTYLKALHLVESEARRA